MKHWLTLAAATFLMSIYGAESSLAEYDPLAANSESAAEPLELVVNDAARGRELPVRIYLPALKQSAAKEPAGVVLFSHGLGGSRGGSTFLGRHWSARGYVVAFLQHPGSDDSLWKDKPVAERIGAMREGINAANFQLRVKDVPAVIDQLERWNQAAGHELAGRLDLSHLGMSGHSFGAVTTQAVSGQNAPARGQVFSDKRIRAAIVFSPSKPAIGDVERAFADVKIPWLLMTGTKDIAQIGGATIGAADMASRLAVFPALPPGSKYELVLDGAQHSIFTDRRIPGEKGQRNPKHQQSILAISTAFWDAYLNNDQAARSWLDSSGPRSVLGAADSWKTK